MSHHISSVQLMSSTMVGITTDQIDRRAQGLITEVGAYPSSLLYNGFPKSITTSVNNIVAHGIPDDRPLLNGDIITVDVAVYYKGYHGDSSETFLVGEVDNGGKKLVTAAREIMQAGINCCRPGISFSTLGGVIDGEARKRGLCVLPCVGAHGVGRFLHEYPHIFQFANNYVRGQEKMEKGMVFTVEPAIGQGKPDCVTLSEDNWTVTTFDGSRAAYFEHTILITDTGHEILTE
ncbi:methionine aminopeptidase 1D, mitochondrial-like [Planococcus citri]|uniref:methionine aminopeptidase 1D, mitochondrial-like n=1 Tax=Planococcus citri TaxID=170843 RepID=UPI0031F98E30